MLIENVILCCISVSSMMEFLCYSDLSRLLLSRNCVDVEPHFLGG